MALWPGCCPWLENRRGQVWTLVVICGLGVALQIITLFGVIEPDELFWADPKNHYAIAQQLASGEPFSTPEDQINLKYSPGYPFILSLMMRAVGTRVVSLRLFHVALFPLFLLSLFLLGRLWRGPKVGLLLAAIAATYPLFLYIPLTMYPESLLIYLFGAAGLLTYYLRKRMRVSVLIALGLVIATAVMIRPTSVTWIPIAIVYLALRRGQGFKKSIAIASLLFVIPAAFAGGWIVRNGIVHDRFTFSVTGAGTLLSTFNENQRGQAKINPLPERIVERLRDTEGPERERVYIEEVRSFIRKHPVWAVRNVLMQCLKTWNPIPQTHTKGGLAGQSYKTIVAIPYALFLSLGIGGMMMERKDSLVRILLFLMVVNTLINGVFSVSVRYRVVADFGFLLPAALVVAVAIWGKSGVRGGLDDRRIIKDRDTAQGRAR